MLTPVEIQNRTFKSGGLGYDKKDVDNFMKEIVESYEVLYREKMELNDKINVLNEGLQYYKTIEKTMQKALILAEKTADETKSAALSSARQIENEATTRAQIMISDANNSLERIHQQTIQLVQQYEAYKVQFKNLAAAQIELLESDSFQIKMMDFAQPIYQKTYPSTNQAVEESQTMKEDNEELPEIDFSFVDTSVATQ